MSEYMKLKENESLIGKKARFKNNLVGYSKGLWLQEGIIKQLFQVKEGDLNYIGISLVFKRKTNDMDSCYIMPNSIELL